MCIRSRRFQLWMCLGEAETVQPILTRQCRILVDRGDVDKVSTALTLAENVEAPVEAGQKLGTMTVYVDGVEQERVDLVAGQAVERLTMRRILSRFLASLFMAD